MLRLVRIFLLGLVFSCSLSAQDPDEMDYPDKVGGVIHQQIAIPVEIYSSEGEPILLGEHLLEVDDVGLVPRYGAIGLGVLMGYEIGGVQGALMGWAVGLFPRLLPVLNVVTGPDHFRAKPGWWTYLPNRASWAARRMVLGLGNHVKDPRTENWEKRQLRAIRIYADPDTFQPTEVKFEVYRSEAPTELEVVSPSEVKTRGVVESCKRVLRWVL